MRLLKKGLAIIIIFISVAKANETDISGETTWKTYVYAKNTGLGVDKTIFKNICSFISNQYASFCYEGFNSSFITSFSLAEMPCVFDYNNIQIKLARRAAYIGMGIELGAQYKSEKDEIKVSKELLYCKNKISAFIVDGFGMGIVHKNSRIEYLKNSCAAFKKYGLENYCLFGVGRGLFFHQNPARYKLIETNKEMLSGFKLIKENGIVRAGYIFATYNAGKEKDKNKYTDFFEHVGYLSYEGRSILVNPRVNETSQRYECMDNIQIHHLDCAMNEAMGEKP